MLNAGLCQKSNKCHSVKFFKVIIIMLIYLLNIAPFNIEMIKSALHEIKNIDKNTIQ